jgi:hypothetical protein
VIARRGLLTAMALGLPAAAIAAPAPAVAGEEWTFLKASSADPAALLRFLSANWLAMDRIAVAQGLFAHARLSQADPADGALWDVVMQVGYKTSAGRMAPPLMDAHDRGSLRLAGQRWLVYNPPEGDDDAHRAGLGKMPRTGTSARQGERRLAVSRHPCAGMGRSECPAR